MKLFVELKWEVQTYFDKNFNQNIHYHKKSVTLIQDLKISESAPIGEHTISATFIYLACDPTKCIPKFDDFSFVINIKEGSPRSEYSCLLYTSPSPRD